MFEGFETLRVALRDVEIHVRRGGFGPALLLLHGYPQTGAMWHAVASRLAESFDVVVPDLRGYGASSKPQGDPEHVRYSKRSMAADVAEVMSRLGHDSFSVAGHDRGARVGVRLSLDHFERVERLAVLDVVPTKHVFDTLTADIAREYWHWFFLSQPFDLPERLIGGDPAGWVRDRLEAWSATDASFDPEAMAEYERSFADPAAIHASCEDYRAGASIDLEHDGEDAESPLPPLLALWGGAGRLAVAFDVLAAWRKRGSEVEGHALACGHFLAEERPAETSEALERFLAV